MKWPVFILAMVLGAAAFAAATQDLNVAWAPPAGAVIDSRPHESKYPEADFWKGKFRPQIMEYRDPTSGFIHPGIGLTKAMLDNMRDHVRAGHEPWLSGYQRMVDANYGMGNPRLFTGGSQWTTINWGHDGNFQSVRFRWDSQTAMLRAIRWYITGDEQFRRDALQAIRLVFKLKEFGEHWDEQITWSTITFKMCVAAEILRCSKGQTEETRWTENDEHEFERVFRKAVRPWYDRWWHLLNQHQYCVKAALSASIYFDDYDWYTNVVPRYTVNGKIGGANGSIKSGLRDMDHNGITGEAYAPVHAQLIEMGRDMGHAWGNVGGFGDNAQIIESQGTKVDQGGNVTTAPSGVSVFDWDNHHLLRGINFMCKYNLGGPAVYVPNDMYWMVNPGERGRIQGLLGLYYYHYKYVSKIPENDPEFAYLAQAYKRMVPEWGDTDSWGFGNVLFAPDEAYDPNLSKDIRNFQHLNFEEPKDTHLFANLTLMEQGEAQVLQGDTPVQEYKAGNPERLLVKFPMADEDNPLKKPDTFAYLRVTPAKGTAEWENVYHSFPRFGTVKLRYRSNGGDAKMRMTRYWEPWELATVELPDTKGEWKTVAFTLEDRYFGNCVIFTLKGEAEVVDLRDIDFNDAKPLPAFENQPAALPPGIAKIQPVLMLTFEDTLNNQGFATITPVIRDFQAKRCRPEFVACTGGGKALRFSGSRYLDYGFSTDLQPQSMTFACSVRFPANPLRPKHEPPTIWDGEQIFLWTKKYFDGPGVFVASSGNRPLRFSIGGTRKFKDHENREQSDIREVYTEGDRAKVFPLDTWVHLAVTYDAASGKTALYINGKDQETREDLHIAKVAKPEAKEFRPMLETKNLIGTDRTSSKVTGINGAHFGCISKFDLDDMVLYPAAATAEKIKALYGQTKGTQP